MAGKFEVYEDKSGKFRFRLKASNGQVIGTSQVYSSKNACVKGIGSVKVNAQTAKFENQTEDDYAHETNPKFEMYQDKAGEFRFRLNARNGKSILASEGYSSKGNCLKGIESIRKNASEATNEEE